MTAMLTRIEQDIAQCTDPDRRAELQAERASYLARTGHFAQANEILATLRKSYGDGRNARVSVWIMFVEGLVLYFDDLDSGARDRISRASLISNAIHFDEMSSLTAAWLAHIDFNRSDFTSMLQNLRHWQGLSTGFGGSSGLRFSLVLADALMHSGHAGLARIWYERTRQEAVRLGDEATLGAMIYNKAAIGLGRLRIESVYHVVDSKTSRHVSMEIASARNFHLAAEHRALPQILEACVARVALLQERFSEALPLLSNLISREGPRLGFQSERTLLQVEHAQCLFCVGEIERAHTSLASINIEDYVKMSLDDQVVFMNTYCQLARGMGLNELALQYEDRFKDCQDKFEREMIFLSEGLANIVRTYN